jgi:16S rRNA G966 N2-methylase RsmD
MADNDKEKDSTIQVDLFGNEVTKKFELRDKYIEPPFSIFDTKQGTWQRRRNKWKALGIESELGRKVDGAHFAGRHRQAERSSKPVAESTQRILDVGEHSIFDPVVCELAYLWFCPKQNSRILDPFAGGSVRGIVASTMGHDYTGIELRKEQVLSNREQAKRIFEEEEKKPDWIVGDSNQVLDKLNKGLASNQVKEYDFIFSCPPYGNLEIYSDMKEDISNMEYDKFLEIYESIIAKSCKLLKQGELACFVVGEFRDKKGHFYGFVPDTINAFKKCGMKFYNEIILLNAIGSASVRASTSMKNRKVVKIHQNVLVFKKI